jgi:hypothetical protein
MTATISTAGVVDLTAPKLLYLILATRSRIARSADPSFVQLSHGLAQVLSEAAIQLLFEAEV